MQSATQEHALDASGNDGDALEKRNKSVEPAYLAALKQFTSGNVREARALVQSMLARNPGDARALHLLGLILYELGDLESAAARLRESVAANPSAVEPVSDLAAILRDLGQIEEALSASLTAVALDADHYPAHANLGHIYRALGKSEKSAACHLQAVEIAPDYARGHCDLGLAWLALGRTGDAVEACRKAVELSPEDTDIVLALGKSLERAGRLEEAIGLYENADLRHKGPLPVLCALASSYAENGQIQQALATHRRSLELAPDYADANIALGDTFRKIGRIAEALDCYQFVLSAAPDHAVAIARAADVQADLGQIEAALESSKTAININAALPAPYRTIARALTNLGKFTEAFAVQARAIMLDRHDMENLPDHFLLARRICDWEDIGETGDALRSACRRAETRLPPSALLDLEASAEDQLLAARSWAKTFACDHPLLPVASKPRSRAGEPIHLGYLYDRCTDGALAGLLSCVIANHDRDRFRVSGFHLGGGSGLAIPEASFDASHRIGDLSHAEAAARIHDAGVDVLVTVDGYYGSRAVAAILAHRPAPVQVSYLGYPATMGAEFVDYIIGDGFTTALDQQPFFDEKIVQLPDCLVAVSPPGASREPSPPPDRPSQRLPENGIVFCCFNPARRISPDCFAVWMNILKNVPGSVLWLLDDNEAATANLKRNAAALGVDPARLVFAPRCGRAEHLARLALADLYFDTMPSSSAAAVSDALAACVPVLTCAGETMVSRISGSLLHACGLSDMITYAHEHYDHAARLLTRDPKSLKQVRARLAGAQKTARLFDAESYQCGLDAAFEHMTAIARNGEWPYAFAVALGKEERQKKRKAVPVTPVEEDETLLLAEADAC